MLGEDEAKDNFGIRKGRLKTLVLNELTVCHLGQTRSSRSRLSPDSGVYRAVTTKCIVVSLRSVSLVTPGQDIRAHQIHVYKRR